MGASTLVSMAITSTQSINDKHECESRSKRCADQPEIVFWLRAMIVFVRVLAFLVGVFVAFMTMVVECCPCLTALHLPLHSIKL